MPGNEKRADHSAWDKQHNWLINWAPKLANTVRPFITNLAMPEAEVQQALAQEVEK
jgi:hypothetical protein